MVVEQFRYDGKRVLVIGGATGMGAATARGARALGANVVVIDVAEIDYPVDQAIRVDLRDQASVDAALAAIADPVHAVFPCAGVADGTRGLMTINFISQRHMVDSLVAAGQLGSGGAIAMISSVAGLGWERNLPQLTEFLGHAKWPEAAAWVARHEGADTYAFSKQVVNAWVAREALALRARGIRLNAILPGPTDTPLARANADVWLTFGAGYRAKAGVEALTSEQMANTLLFLGSAAASGINGVTLLVDHGHLASAVSGSYDEPAVRMLMGLQA